MQINVTRKPGGSLPCVSLLWCLPADLNTFAAQITNLRCNISTKQTFVLYVLNIIVHCIMQPMIILFSISVIKASLHTFVVTGPRGTVYGQTSKTKQYFSFPGRKTKAHFPSKNSQYRNWVSYLSHAFSPSTEKWCFQKHSINYRSSMWSLQVKVSWLNRIIFSLRVL